MTAEEDKNSIYASLDGSTVHFSENRLWWPYWRTTFWATLAKGVSLSAGEHTLTISVDVNGVQFYGFRVCTDFSEEPTAGEAKYTLAPRKFKDVNGDMVGPATGFKLTLEMLGSFSDIHLRAQIIFPEDGGGKAGIFLGSLFCCYNYDSQCVELYEGSTLKGSYATSFAKTPKAELRSNSNVVYTIEMRKRGNKV